MTHLPSTSRFVPHLHDGCGTNRDANDLKGEA